jgi:hypothetical protein
MTWYTPWYRRVERRHYTLFEGVKMKESNEIKVTFTTVWDDGPMIITPAIYNPETGKVTAETADVDPDGCLISQYITLPSGEEIFVCDTCHEYTLKGPEGARECRNPGMQQL